MLPPDQFVEVTGPFLRRRPWPQLIDDLGGLD
jgi:hypothetical protein